MDLITIVLLFIVTIQLCVRIVRYYTNEETFQFTFLSILAIAGSIYFINIGEIGFAIFIILVNMRFGVRIDKNKIKKIKDDMDKFDE